MVKKVVKKRKPIKKRLRKMADAKPKTAEELEKEKLEKEELAKKVAQATQNKPTAESQKSAEKKENKPDFKAVSHPGSVAPKIVGDKLAKEREEIHNKIEEALRKFGGNESEIPLSDEYWSLKNQY